MLDLIPGSDRLPAVVGAAWTEDPLWSALVVAVVASATAAAWPWLAARQRRRRFQSLIRRELEEVGPQPRRRTDQPWWSHLTKRFVHEEIFRPQNISENRDFILSMDSSVTYLVSQLWISFEKRDGEQWLHYLDELAGAGSRRRP